MVDEGKKQHFSLYFIGQRASLSLTTRLSSQQGWRWTYFNTQSFRTPPSRNIKNNKARKSAGSSRGGSNNKKLIWFVNVCNYAFKLHLVTPLWADGVWHMPEQQQQKPDISTANIFQLQLQMMSVDRLHCVCVWVCGTWIHRCTAVCVQVSNMFHHVTFHLAKAFGLNGRF